MRNKINVIFISYAFLPYFYKHKVSKNEKKIDFFPYYPLKRVLKEDIMLFLVLKIYDKFKVFESDG